MSFDKPTSGSTSSSAASAPLLPSHRFYSAASIKASPIYAIPVHYLKRRGVVLLLTCMAAISYVHYVYLLPSSDRSLTRSAGSDLKDNDYPLFDSKHLPDYMSVGEIREPPLLGVAPVNGVDEDGFEIVEELFLGKNDNSHEQLKNSYGVDLMKTHTNLDSASKIRRPIQFNFRDTMPRTGARADQNKQRLTMIRDMIKHAWTGYVRHAAPHDELKPVISDKLDALHGWGASLIEGMDTLLLANMTEEYQTAKKMFMDRVKKHRWDHPDSEQDQEESEKKAATANTMPENGDGSSIGFFDSVVRYLGGLLSIVELEKGKDPEVLQAAVKLGDRLVQAFRGSNNALPASKIFQNGTIALNEVLAGKVSLAEVGTFQLEFRKLSQLSNNNKYMDIAQENFDYLASLKPKVPGLYPAYFDPDAGVAQDYLASFGSLSDSFYEYLLKSYILTGDVKFRELYISTVEAMHAHLISRPHKKTEPHLVLGVYNTATATLAPKMDHLSCFAPGLLALGARVLGRPKDMGAARRLMETCYLSYKNSATGLGADEIGFLASEYSKGTEFEMPPPSGFYVIDPEYGLRPEIIESLFVMYRITGDDRYQDYAWEIAQAIEKNCRTRTGYSTLANVMDASEGMTDHMPSHFLGQTLKYLYLIFSMPEIASLDDYLFTTEGHLLKYPVS